ncbi:MAG TPA: PGPGW domain-containing protein [Frankiaceae bacterium]|nr:PGPGW domain-containing protein [Frankiaceae bacterium]
MPSTDSRSADTNPAPALDGEAPAPKDSWRDRTRRKPGIGHAYRVGVFLLGLALIALGGVLIVLPGPLTIPPVLLGLYVWSTEFSWAHRLFESSKHKGKQAWEHAKVHPVSSSIITVGGIAGAAVVVFVVHHFDLVSKAEEAVGIG